MPPKGKEPARGGISKPVSDKTRAKHEFKILAVKSYTANKDDKAIREQNFRNFVIVDSRAAHLQSLPISNQQNWEDRHSKILMWEFTSSELKQYPAMVYITNKTKDGGKVDVVSVFFDGMFRTVLVNYIDSKPSFYIDYNRGPTPEEQGTLNGRFVKYDQSVFNTEKYRSGPTSPSGSPQGSPARGRADMELEEFLNEPVSPPRGRAAAGPSSPRSSMSSLPGYSTDEELHHFGKAKRSRKVTLRRLKSDLKRLRLM